MKIYVFFLLFGLMSSYVSEAAQISHSQNEDNLKTNLERAILADGEQSKTECEKLAPTIYKKLLQRRDLRVSKRLEECLQHLHESEHQEEEIELWGTICSVIIFSRMDEEYAHSPHSHALMRDVRARLNQTEWGKLLLTMMDREREVRRALRRGDTGSESLNTQLVKDIEAFQMREQPEPQPTLPESFRAYMRVQFLRSEKGGLSSGAANMISMEDNPYQEGMVGKLSGVDELLPSTQTPVFTCTIGKKLRDTMSLAEVYQLLRQELGKGATPYIFAIKYSQGCISDNDVDILRRYVQTTTYPEPFYHDPVYSDPEAAYLLASYLWNDTPYHDPADITREFEIWKEGYMLMIQLARQNYDQATLFLLLDLLLNKEW